MNGLPSTLTFKEILGDQILSLEIIVRKLRREIENLLTICSIVVVCKFEVAINRCDVSDMAYILSDGTWFFEISVE
jgi:hypothetical protein